MMEDKQRKLVCLNLLNVKSTYLGTLLDFFKCNSVWYENGIPYLQKLGVCGNLSILAIDWCLQIVCVTYYHIWAY